MHLLCSEIADCKYGAGAEEYRGPTFAFGRYKERSLMDTLIQILNPTNNQWKRILCFLFVNLIRMP